MEEDGVAAKRTKRFKSLSLLNVNKLAEGLKDVIYLNVGEPDFDTPRHIVMVAEKALRQGHTHYASNEGILPLKRAIVDKENKKMKTELRSR